ncbi:chromate transporter [Bacteroidales bacterium]|nr:chromate transporter [Bacteroidales bacterium]
MVYFKIGLFGFGGGYAMLSLIQDEVVIKHGWISSETFANIIAISQMTPGPIGINSATYIGYEITGSVWGSIVASFAVCLPSFILLLVIIYFFKKFHYSKIVKDVFSGLRPATVGLIAAAALLLMNKETFIDHYSYIIFIIAFILTYYFKLHPIILIIAAAISGLFIY